MARDWGQRQAGQGVLVPRWLVLAVPAVILVYVIMRVVVPPAIIVQQLDAPEGGRRARLLRTRYINEHFAVYGSEGHLWRTLFYGPPLTNDYRVDLGERLSWSPDGRYLYLKMKNQYVWGYDWEARKPISRAELPRLKP